MIEKLIPIGFTLIVFGAIGFIVEYFLFDTMYMILIAYFGLLLAAVPLGVILCRREDDVKK